MLKGNAHHTVLTLWAMTLFLANQIASLPFAHQGCHYKQSCTAVSRGLSHELSQDQRTLAVLSSNKHIYFPQRPASISFTVEYFL